MRRIVALAIAAYLLIWVPANYAAELLVTLPSIRMRGIPAAVELAAHGAVAALAAAAGWMVYGRADAARPFAMAAVLAAGLVSLQSLAWSVLPRNTAPGDALPLAAIASAVTLLGVGAIRLAIASPE